MPALGKVIMGLQVTICPLRKGLNMLLLKFEILLEVKSPCLNGLLLSSEDFPIALSLNIPAT